MAESVSRSTIAEEVYTELNEVKGLSKALVSRLVSIYEEKIVDHVAKGDRVSLAGFAIFESRVRESRQARNPRTGETIEVPEKRVPVIKPGNTFKNAVK